MTSTTKELHEMLLDYANREKEHYERTTLKALKCNDIQGALIYGRVQGIEMAADLLLTPRGIMIINKEPNP